jgi:predicted MFS family arabinose efflux permease
VFSIAYGLSQLFFGPVGDRYGKYFIVACATLASAAAAILCTFAQHFSFLLAGRLLFGLTAAGILPLSMAWIGDVVPYQLRQPVLARFLIGQIFGLSSGVLVGGIAADFGDWRLPFYLVALIFLAISLALFSLNRHLPLHARATHRADGPVVRRMIGEFRQVFAQRWARFVLLSVFLEGAFLYGAFAFIATHVFRTFDMSLSSAGALIMLYGFGGFVFAIASRMLVQRLGETGLSLWGGVLVAGALLMIGLAPVWWWMIPGCLIAGLGFYMIHNTLQINATQMAPERRGAAVSAFSSCYFLGQSVGVGIAGLVVGTVGTAAIIVAGGCGMLLIALRVSRALKIRLTQNHC